VPYYLKNELLIVRVDMLDASNYSAGDVTKTARADFAARRTALKQAIDK
jgi:hypothetical protein